MNKVPILLIGAGGYGEFYLEKLLKESPDRELVAVSDPFVQKSRYFSELKARQIPIYDSPEDFYKEREAALTIVSSPIHTHVQYTLLALDNGSNVLCEKPFCADLARFDEVLRRVKETGLFVDVGFQLCHSQAVLALKEDIRAGFFGRPLRLKALCLPRRGNVYYRRNAWAGKLSFEGMPILDSPLNNACAHELQLMLFLLGKDAQSPADILSLEGKLWKARKDIENFDAAALRLKTDAGAEVLFYTAHCVEFPHTGPWGEFTFEKGIIRWGENSPSEKFTVIMSHGEPKDYGPIGEARQKLDNAVDAVRELKPPSCPLSAARSQVKAVIMAKELPVTAVPSERISQGQDEGGDTFFYAPGLAEALIQGYHENKLPNEGV